MGTKTDVAPLAIQDTLIDEAEEVSIYSRSESPLVMYVSELIVCEL